MGICVFDRREGQLVGATNTPRCPRLDDAATGPNLVEEALSLVCSLPKT
jgi:hypothetical protein